MAKPVALQLEKFIKKIEKVIDKDIVSRETLRRIGKDVADRIKLRTRLGYGVSENGAPRQQLRSMRRHSDPYARFRQSHPSALSSLTAAKKHNLTLTGQMLESLVAKNIDATKKRVEIGFNNSFAQIKADVNTKLGWKFLNLSDVEVKAVNNFYRREVERLVKRSNLV